jgi:hypothetical protein
MRYDGQSLVQHFPPRQTGYCVPQLARQVLRTATIPAKLAGVISPTQ